MVGETYNEVGRPQVGAIAYGVASTGGYVLKDDSHYIKPEVVSKIPNIHAPPAPGPVEVVEEVKLKKLNCEFYFRSLLPLITMTEVPS